jgi:L-asparaginase / beta-aspartyl-peptidase
MTQTISPTQSRCAVAVHGGAGNSKTNEDGCVTAAHKAAQALAGGKQGLDAAIAAVTSLEDDGRFNAGVGSVLGIDGETYELDASVMDSRGSLGAVACVSTVRNPVLLAQAVSRTPHCFLVGEGAERFARVTGLEAHRHGSERARNEHREMLKALTETQPLLPGIDNAAFRRWWNYPMPWDEALKRYGCGTVGAVTRDAQGHFAVATSTGGSAPSLLGRVGDSPLVGSGFYCGPLGAIGATGIGEAIIRRLLARTVYGWIEAGQPLQEALDAGIALFDDDIDVGLIGVTATELGTASNRAMPVACWEA